MAGDEDTTQLASLVPVALVSLGPGIELQHDTHHGDRHSWSLIFDDGEYSTPISSTDALALIHAANGATTTVSMTHIEARSRRR